MLPVSYELIPYLVILEQKIDINCIDEEGLNSIE
jgi:hypothetical protein